MLNGDQLICHARKLMPDSFETPCGITHPHDGAAEANTVSRASESETRSFPRWIGWFGESAIRRSPPVIPKKIWSYWNTTDFPDIVVACARSWEVEHADYERIIVTPATLSSYLTAVPAFLMSESPQRQSDWVRLALLSRHGGIWLDATTLVFRSLNFVHEIQQQHALDFVGYFNRDKTHNAAFPMVENWFLAAPPNSPFVTDWLMEFDKSMRNGGERYVDEVSARHDIKNLLQGFDDRVYFSMHIAAQVCLRHPNSYALCLMAAETDAFKLAADLFWDVERIADSLTQLPTPLPDCNLLKLINLTWRPIEQRLRRGQCHSLSILGKLLAHHSS
jgi:hypothetical protein